LKKVAKTWDLDPASKTNARKVEKPPLKTAGPISARALLTLSALVPVEDMKAWATWAE